MQRKPRIWSQWHLLSSEVACFRSKTRLEHLKKKTLSPLQKALWTQAQRWRWGETLAVWPSAQRLLNPVWNSLNRSDPWQSIYMRHSYHIPTLRERKTPRNLPADRNFFLATQLHCKKKKMHLLIWLPQSGQPIMEFVESYRNQNKKTEF